MTSNLTIWDKFADIDPSFTKAITGKAYKGTSPNPQYVIKCLTELFGPVGVGFGWEVIQEDFTNLGEEVLHWCRIRFWHTDRSNTYDAYGQTKALMKTRNGMMSDEDAPKKSLTDAIIKASSQLGIAANIFLGRWDDQKYVQSVKDDFAQSEPANSQNSQPKNEETRALFTALQNELRLNKTQGDLGRWWRDPDCAELRLKLPTDWQADLKNQLKEYGATLGAETQDAAE
ncbi:hypothetical protein KHQ08_06930 [Pseudochrobactrum algeriensis]|uniref:hypothetical protein n=1 Tax=Pseudochrobactrum algeriensis TaxID=2834768 RepID=UPI001BD0BACD|nr:hypothetical protein [Pseudochrobactrum algeriensis]QVQ37749.1 hypothetical protein KHQ08_06930 [Pseudochrobactrum algeriensis]QVQ40969.1 hypothetical protein KHQ07_05230 [Pseudochrobactrum algeriensis]QVQ44893.1 hypothetical protein KHQ09_07195 [Pseudochrobactrum algeriensis]